jgi:hypothetical protein
MRFTAAVKSADPRGGLGGGAKIPDICLQNADNAVFILAFADEVLQLIPERLEFVFGRGLADAGYAIVLEFVRQRVASEEVTVFHASRSPLKGVMGIAR